MTNVSRPPPSYPWGMRRVAALVLVLASWGCSGSDENPRAVVLWCDAVCAVGSRCGGAGATSCSYGCQRERPQLDDISVDGARPLSACLEQMNCADLRGGDERWDAAYGACWDQAKSAVEVTASVRAFCEIYTLAEFDCGYWYAMDACERDFGMWSEGLRNRVTACVTNRTCSVAESCLSALFEGR